MEDGVLGNTATMPIGLATVAENEPPMQDTPTRAPTEAESDDGGESHSGSVVEKDGASASGSTSSEELMFVDESVASAVPKRKDDVQPTAASPFGVGRSAKLPPRAPVCPGDPEVEGVLPSQPSIVRRMQEANKHDVDPKDARTLLPGVLLNSGSLDLDGVIDDAPSRAAEKKLQEEALLNLLRQKEWENLLIAQQQQQEQQRQQQELLLAATASGLDLEMLTNAFSEQCRVSPPGFPQQPSFAQPQPEMQSNNYLLQQMMTRPRHGRSASDPTFAFAGALNSMMPPPTFPQQPQQQQSTPMDTVTTTPLMDQSDALAFLNLSNLQPQDWPAPDTQQPVLQPNLGGLLSVPKSVPPEMPKMETSIPQRRRKHGPSKSVDFNVLMKQNKAKNSGSTNKDRCLPLSPSTGSKSVTRAEVKKLVEDQAKLGRPTYAPWFRDRHNRNNSGREGDAPAEIPPTHFRTQSLPQVNTAPKSPKDSQDPQQPTPKSGRAGTGVFFPRMQVPN